MFALMMMLGCGDHAKDKTEAVVEAAKKVEAAPVGAKTLKVDPKGSRIRATGAKVVGSHPIDFHDFTGTVQVDGEAVKSLSFDVTMKTLTSDDERLTKHLLNEDFFHVDKHASSSFVSTEVKEGGEKTTHTITGNLSVMGKSKSVTFPADIKVHEGVVSAQTEFTVNRQDFGITYAGKADNLIQDKVILQIELIAK